MRRAAVLALLVLAGCGDSAPKPPAPQPTPGTPAEREHGEREPTAEEQIQALLEPRAEALEGGRAQAFAATSTGAQRRLDLRIARTARKLRLEDVRLEAENVVVRGRRARLRIDTAYSVPEINGRFHSSRRATAVRVGGQWRLRTLEGARGLPPWEVSPLTVRRTEHFVVIAPPTVPVDFLLADLESGYDQMRGRLRKGTLRRRYLVVVAGDPAHARALTSHIRGVETLTALSDAAIRETGPQREVSDVVSVRLLVIWPRFSALDPLSRRRVVTHELTHAALAGATSGRTPAWLVEGVALYVSGDRRAAPPGAGLGPLSQPDAIGRLTGEAQALAYATSSAAAFAIADRFGRRRLLALYDAFNDPELLGAPGRRLAARAVRRELGIGLGDVLS